MADNNKLELIVEVDVNKANASIKSINTGLSSMEQAAGKAARGASAGIDGLTVSMVKGSAARQPALDNTGNGFPESFPSLPFSLESFAEARCSRCWPLCVLAARSLNTLLRQGF